mgnify:CR=1 FL=1
MISRLIELAVKARWAVMAIVLIVAGLWYAFISGTSDEHDAEIERETRLNRDFRTHILRQHLLSIGSWLLIKPFETRG